jgi:hypothetical protein
MGRIDTHNPNVKAVELEDLKDGNFFASDRFIKHPYTLNGVE